MAIKFNLTVLCSLIISAICSYIPPPAAPVGRAVVARAVPTSWSLPHRVAAVQKTLDVRTPMLAERQTQQIPFQWCPEFFNNPPKLCSQCGGDNIVKGTCDNLLISGQQSSRCQLVAPYPGCYGYMCKCSDDGGPDNSPKVTSTTVIDGQTGTAVWEPLTLTEYSRLQASTTVTLSESATSSGDSEVETVIAVVFAGGVAWWLAVQSGAGGAALGLQPPSARPEGSRDDNKSCKQSPKEECPNCGGGDALGLCTSGSESGCPCDEKQECPNPAPQCSTPDCGGDSGGDSRCTNQGSGLGGCICCPDTPPVCSIDDCEGDDNNKCTAPLYQGCTCNLPVDYADVEIDPDDPPLDNASVQSSAAADVFTRIWGANYNSIPGYTTSATQTSIYCLHGAAPNQNRVPDEYCQCGANYATFYSVATGTNPCPWNPTSTGQIVTFSTPPVTTPTPTPTPTPPPTHATTTAPSPPPTTTTSACNYGWCGAPFCDPLCGPNGK